MNALSGADWRYIVTAWLVGGIAPRTEGVRARTWEKSPRHVLTAAWKGLVHGPARKGFVYDERLRAFRLHRDTLRTILKRYAKDELHHSCRAEAWVKNASGIFYQGRAFYDAATRLVATERFSAWQKCQLSWEDLEIPAAVLEDVERVFGISARGTIPYEGAVFNGYLGRDTIWLGVSDDASVIDLLRLSARHDLRDQSGSSNAPVAFSPAERAQWLSGNRDPASIARLLARAKGTPPLVIAPYWPTDKTILADDPQTFTAAISGIARDHYRLWWQVDGQAEHEMQNSPGGDYKEATGVDVRRWQWRGKGPYWVNFIARNRDWQHGGWALAKSVRVFIEHPEWNYEIRPDEMLGAQTSRTP